MQNQSNADVRFHVQLDQSGFVTVEIGKESLTGLLKIIRFGANCLLYTEDRDGFE